MIIRTLVSTIILLALFFVPWWSIVVAGVVAAMRFRFYFEVIIIGYFLDMLYMQPPYQFTFTLSAIGVVALMYLVHSYIRHDF